RKRKRERIAALIPHSRAELRCFCTRAIEMRLLEVDTDERRLRILRRQQQLDLPCSTSDVEDRSAADRMAIEDRLLLRPDRFHLRREVAHHRFIGHFPGLRAARAHAGTLTDGGTSCCVIRMRWPRSR